MDERLWVKDLQIQCCEEYQDQKPLIDFHLADGMEKRTSVVQKRVGECWVVEYQTVVLEVVQSQVEENRRWEVLLVRSLPPRCLVACL